MGLFGGGNSTSNSSTVVTTTDYIDSLNTTINRVSNLNDVGNIKLGAGAFNVGGAGGNGSAINPIDALLDYIGLGPNSDIDQTSFFYQHRQIIVLGVIALVFFIAFKSKKGIF